MTDISYTLEVVVLPVSDINLAVVFHRDRVGFTLDVDYAPHPRFRVVQLTPARLRLLGAVRRRPDRRRPRERPAHPPGRHRPRTGQDGLVAQGANVGGVTHEKSLDTWAGEMTPGIDAERRDRASFAKFSDPEGNT